MKQKEIDKIKTKNNDDEPVFIYICISISLILCAVLRFSLIIENYLKSIVITILFFVPTLISISLLLLNQKKKIKLTTVNIIQSLFIIPSIIYIFFLSFISLLIQLNDGGVNKPINYRRARSHYNLDYFPKKIPQNAKNVMFHYNSQFLQGGGILSLYFKGDNDIIEYYNNKYKKFKLDENNIKEYEKQIINNKIWDSTPYNNSEETDKFTVYLIYNKCDDSGYCNHGTIKIIAINHKTNEILFYYENW